MGVKDYLAFLRHLAPLPEAPRWGSGQLMYLFELYAAPGFSSTRAQRVSKRGYVLRSAKGVKRRKLRNYRAPDAHNENRRNHYGFRRLHFGSLHSYTNDWFGQPGRL